MSEKETYSTTIFQEYWLNDPRYKVWVRRVPNQPQKPLFILRIEIQRQTLDSTTIELFVSLQTTKVQKTRQGGLEALIHENVVSFPGNKILLVAGGP